MGNIYFSSDLFLTLMVRYIKNFNILSQKFTLSSLLDELVYVKGMNEKFTTEVKIVQQQK